MPVQTSNPKGVYAPPANYSHISRLAEFNAIRAKYFGDARPASALVEVTALVDPEWMIEVELVALV